MRGNLAAGEQEMAVIVAGLQECVVARLEIGEARKWSKMLALENEVLHIEFPALLPTGS